MCGVYAIVWKFEMKMGVDFGVPHTPERGAKERTPLPDSFSVSFYHISFRVWIAVCFLVLTFLGVCMGEAKQGLGLPYLSVGRRGWHTL